MSSNGLPKQITCGEWLMFAVMDLPIDLATVVILELFNFRPFLMDGSIITWIKDHNIGVNANWFGQL